MAGSLLPNFDNSLQIEGMRMQSQLLQQLGAQVRTDIQTIQTNRQLQGLAQAAQNVNTNSPDFPKQIVGLLSQYPMAAQSPVGAAAINQLGAAHREWRQQQIADTAFGHQLGLLAVNNADKNRPYGSPAMTVPQMKDIAAGRTSVEPALPVGPGSIAGQPSLTTPGADLPPATATIAPLPGQPVMQIPVPMGGSSIPAGIGAIRPQIDKLMQMDAELRARGVPRHAAEAALRNEAANIGDVQPVHKIVNDRGEVFMYSRDGQQVIPMLDPNTGRQMKEQPAVSERPIAQQRYEEVQKARDAALEVRKDAEKRMEQASKRMELKSEESSVRDLQGQLDKMGIKNGVEKKDGKYITKTVMGDTEVSQSRAERWMQLSETLEKRRKKLDEMRTNLEGGSTTSKSDIPGISETTDGGIIAGGKIKLDPKTGIHWEVGPDGKLTGRHSIPTQ